MSMWVSGSFELHNQSGTQSDRDPTILPSGYLLWHVNFQVVTTEEERIIGLLLINKDLNLEVKHVISIHNLLAITSHVASPTNEGVGKCNSVFLKERRN